MFAQECSSFAAKSLPGPCNGARGRVVRGVTRVDKYTEHSDDMKWGDMPIWVAFLILQLLAIAVTWVGVNYVFPKIPTFLGIPFLFLWFVPVFFIYATSTPSEAS